MDFLALTNILARTNFILTTFNDLETLANFVIKYLVSTANIEPDKSETAYISTFVILKYGWENQKERRENIDPLLSSTVYLKINYK